MLIVNRDILDVPADALILTLDGARPGMEGNIARQFAKRWPEDWPDMVRALRFPIPIGRCVALPWEGDAPWKLFLFAATLHHVDVLDEGEKSGVVSRAFLEALRLCVKHGARSVATPILQGGWRLSRDEALAAMCGPACWRRPKTEPTGLPHETWLSCPL